MVQESIVHGSIKGGPRDLGLLWFWGGWQRAFCGQAEGVSLWATQKPVSLSAGAVCEIPAQVVPGYTRKRGLPDCGRAWSGSGERLCAEGPGVPSSRVSGY